MLDNPHNLTWHTKEICVHYKQGPSLKDKKVYITTGDYLTSQFKI